MRLPSFFLALSVLAVGASLACSGASEDPAAGATEPGDAASGTAPTPTGGASVASGDASAPTGDAGPEATYESKLYALPQTSYAVTRIGEAIEALVAAKPAIEGVLLYVHGRSCGGGGEPQKSLESVVPDMETEYGAGVLMFFWPGSDDGCPLGFPEPQARKAGPALRATLSALASYAATKPAALAQRKVTLITHSLGNIVLESALATKTGVPGTLVANAIVQSSAAALTGHAGWLANLDFAERAFVTVNGQDKVLAAAELVAGPRLGHGLGTEKLTSRAAYVDFTAAGVNHQYYVASGQKGAGLKAFYQDVMRGRPYDLAGSSAIGKRETRDGATVYTFK